LTKASNRLPWTAPPGYSAATYELLRRYIVANGYTSATSLLGLSSIKGAKYDVNNAGAVSTDFIGGNYNYPEADYATRAQIIQNHRNYQQGLFYFLATDPNLPTGINSSMKLYGLTTDEFIDNGGWSDQLYVREARRMIGAYVMTEKDVQGTTTISDPVAFGSYTMDSHHTQRFVASGGSAWDEGNLQVRISTTTPYLISYRAITPKPADATNLLVVADLSASHISYASLRVESVFMSLGQVAGTAASMAIDDQTTVQNVAYVKLRAQLVANGIALPAITGTSVVCDNADSTGITTTGTWLASTVTSGFYGINYLQDNDVENGSASIRFTPTIPVTGTYSVQMNWTAALNRATNVPVKIARTGGTSTISVNEQNNGAWFTLGQFSFAAGTSGNVLITDIGTNGYVVADAVRFVQVAPSASLSIWATNGWACEPFGTTAARTATITIARTGSTTSSLPVHLTIGGTAQNGVDYATIPTLVTIPANATSTTLTITPMADNLAEGPETVIVGLDGNLNSLPSNAPSSATAIIQDKPFDNWRFVNFPGQLGNANISGPSAIPQSDRTANLLKYFSDIAPNVPMSASDCAALPFSGWTTVGSTPCLTLTYRQNPFATDVVITVQTSSDLVNWQTVTPDHTVMSLDATTGDPITQIQINATGNTRRFVRLNVTLP